MIILDEQVRDVLESLPKMKKDVHETYVIAHEEIPFEIDFARFKWLEGYLVLITKIYYKNGASIYTCHTSQGTKISVSNCDYEFFIEEVKEWLNKFH